MRSLRLDIPVEKTFWLLEVKSFSCFLKKNSWQKLYNGLQKYIGLTIESVAHP